MKNRPTFTNIVNILLENKKKTYQQHQLVHSLFSECLNDELRSDEIYAEDNTMYSRWCTGAPEQDRYLWKFCAFMRKIILRSWKKISAANHSEPDK